MGGRADGGMGDSGARKSGLVTAARPISHSGLAGEGHGGSKQGIQVGR